MRPPNDAARRFRKNKRKDQTSRTSKSKNSLPRRAIREQGSSKGPCTLKPWSKAVNGAKLLKELAAVFKRHLVLPKGAEYVLSLWTVHAYVFDSFDVTPRLAITSPTHRCGKTNVITLLNMLVASAELADNITTAAAFRMVDEFGTTLLIDEADSFLQENRELRSVLNAGHKRTHPLDHVVTDFPCATPEIRVIITRHATRTRRRCTFPAPCGASPSRLAPIPLPIP